jgi:hypothetical protein
VANDGYDAMTRDRVKIVASLLLLVSLALPAYTCEGYVGPRGTEVSFIPRDANPAEYHAVRIAHYPLEGQHFADVWFWLTILTFAWPLPFLLYRRRRAPVGRWVIWAEPVFALASGFFVYYWSLLGRFAVGTYLALVANAVLLGTGASEAWSARLRPLQRGQPNGSMKLSGRGA